MPTHWRDTLTADEVAELTKIIRWYKTHPVDNVRDGLVLKLVNLMDAASASRRVNTPPHVTPFLKE